MTWIECLWAAQVGGEKRLTYRRRFGAHRGTWLHARRCRRRSIRPSEKDAKKTEMGTLGSGNHYLEIQLVDEIYDDKIARAFNVEKRRHKSKHPLWLAGPRPPNRHRLSTHHGNCGAEVRHHPPRPRTRLRADQVADSANRTSARCAAGINCALAIDKFLRI